jgi:hypothetical protein
MRRLERALPVREAAQGRVDRTESTRRRACEQDAQERRRRDKGSVRAHDVSTVRNSEGVAVLADLDVPIFGLHFSFVSGTQLYQASPTAL